MFGARSGMTAAYRDGMAPLLDDCANSYIKPNHQQNNYERDDDKPCNGLLTGLATYRMTAPWNPPTLDCRSVLE